MSPHVFRAFYVLLQNLRFGFMEEAGKLAIRFYGAHRCTTAYSRINPNIHFNFNKSLLGFILIVPRTVGKKKGL
jgi:hypothetical protein